MAIGMITMMLANVGLSMFNTWRNRCTNELLQEKQRAFQRAAQERNSERMLQLLREGEALNEEIEKELHQERLKNVETDFDDLLTKVFESQAIQNWPLRVLPMVMKNESLGTKIVHNQEAIAVHCIFTPSNDNAFNQSVYKGIDRGLEFFCNNHLNDFSGHPAIYYSGAWKSNSSPSGPEISLLKTKLPNLPVILLRPFFPPQGAMVFQIDMWGMGDNQTIEFAPEHLSYSYNRSTKYDEDLINSTIEEFVPLLSYIIGFLTDAYFWSLYGTQPITPTLLRIGAINTDGMTYLLSQSKEQYLTLLTNGNEQLSESPLNGRKVLRLYDGIAPILDDSEKDVKLDEVLMNYCHSRYENEPKTISELCRKVLFTKEDRDFLSQYFEKSNNKNNQEAVKTVLNAIDKQLPSLVIQNHDSYSLKEVFEWAVNHIPEKADSLRIFYVENVNLLTCFYMLGKEVIIQESDDVLIVIIKHLSVPTGISFDGSLSLPVNQIKKVYEQIKLL